MNILNKDMSRYTSRREKDGDNYRMAKWHHYAYS